MSVSASIMGSALHNASTTISPSISTTATDPEKQDGELLLLVVSCVCCSLWLIYMTFYHSRLLGSIITNFVTYKYLKKGEYLEIGSFSFSMLSGMVMFRDVKYITKDLSIRIVDGYAIFKYWLPYVAEDSRQPYNVSSTETTTEIESKEHRLTIWMNCFEYHIYNRAGIYDQLQDLFRVERFGDAARSSLNIHNVIDTAKKAIPEGDKSVNETNKGLPTWLLELIPAIKFDISTGKIAFGNKLFETTLCFLFENAVGFYTTSEAHSSLDQFMHVVKMSGKDVRIMLCPSPGYNGPKDEPPRYMGNGFVVLHTAQCKISYYQDEPGLVPDGNVGDEEAGIIPDSDPHWGVDIAFLKSTSICYGPWVDRQRDALQKFFFPMDYQEMVATKPLPPGQTRLHTGLDVKFHFQVDATLDILFSKDQETKAVHVCFGAGSHVGVYQPWTVNEYGYTTSVITKLYQVEASTSMAYRKLVDADVLDLAVHMTFPRLWNHTQHWSCEINAVHVTWWFIFAHKWYFQEMLEDWTGNYRPDLVTFVPYEWSFNIVLRDFEMVWIANEYNYMECTSTRQEMAELAFCGELFDLTFVLQFLRFVPEFEEIKFFLQVEKLVARICLPEHDTLHRSLLCLARTTTKTQIQPSAIRSRSSTSTGFPEEGIESADDSALPGSSNDTFSTIFSRHTAKNHGWVDVMSVPILGLSIGYVYHPIIRNPKYNVSRDKPLKWQPTDMEPDVITLELEAGPASLRLFGSVLRVMAAIKENYFGEDQIFQECPSFNSNISDFTVKEASDTIKDTINLFALRPLEANVFISLYDFKAELTKHCGVNEPSSPLLLFERLTFEMKKSYAETRLQLHLTPMTIIVTDGYERGMSARHLSRGHLSLSGFQLRGHAMFSGEGLPPDTETLEYAWLTELQFGILSGKVTLPQLQALMNWAQTFAFHILSKENKLNPPIPYKRCVHGHRQDKCPVNKPKLCESHQKSPEPQTKNERNSKGKNVESNKKQQAEKSEEDPPETKVICITEDDVKYRMTRMSLEDINLFVVETGIACNLQVSPIRLATCTLHCDNSTSGISMFIQNVKLRQFVLAPKLVVADPVFDDIHKRMSLSDDIVWIEAANVQLGPIISDVSLAEDRKENLPDQRSFLELHDKKYQRLWFLWSASCSERSPIKKGGCCGCVGGCNFFGKNWNGPKFFTSEKLDASFNDTGITGFGSDGGFYEEGDFHEEDTKPLMYSRDALGSAYLEQSPVGSVEAFTRKRYHGSEASSSPRMRRGYLMRNKQSNMEEIERNMNNPTPHPSWQGSMPRSPSMSSSKMRYIATSSLGGSKPSLVKKPRVMPLHSCSSQGSFYSCGSLVNDEEELEDDEDEEDEEDEEDDVDVTDTRGRLHSAFSVESFTSAVENPHELPDFVDGQVPEFSDFVISCPELVNRYSQQLSQLECLNWCIPADIPPNKRVFNIVENLKETEPSDPFVLPGVPQFNYRNPPKFKQPLLINRSEIRKEKRDQDSEADISSSSSQSPQVVADGNMLTRKSYREDDSLEESSEQDSVRKVNWNTALNEIRRASASSGTEFITDKHSTKPSSSLRNLIIFRFDGEINLFFTPLLVDAFQRYASSVSRQDSILHPALVVDLVHKICTSTAENIYQKRLQETNLEDSMSSKPNEVTAFISTSKINLCFLQVAIPQVEMSRSVIHITVEGEDGRLTKEPSTSILAAEFDDISTKLLSIQKAADNSLVTSKNNIEEVDDQSAVKDRPSESSVVHKIAHRNTSSVINIKCNQAQLQVHELCNKEDFEKSVTTAIPDNLSRTKFSMNVEHLHSLTDSQSTNNMPPNTYLNLLMLECGLENITVCGGSECGSGSEVLPKIHQKSQQTKVKTKPKQENGDAHHAEDEMAFHGFSNPFSEDSGSVVLNLELPQEEDHSHKIDLSSLSSSSLSSLSSNSSGGNDSDVESAGELMTDEEVPKMDYDCLHHERDTLIDKDVELARRIDVKFQLSSIWFNISSPPSSKALPSNYHLYNSLVTTIVPLSIAWIPGVLELNEKMANICNSRRDRMTSVVACLMSQALPDHGKIPKKHGIHILATTNARFLQEDHSSQLIYILRKQLLGSRLEKVQSALSQKARIPENKKLVKGIFALARQWKCFLAGTEKGEILFYGTNSIKRHVVGRGVLTDRDRAIIMKDDHHTQGIPPQEPTSKPTAGSHEVGEEPRSIISDDQQQQDEPSTSAAQLPSKFPSSTAQSLPLEEIQLSPRTPLLESTSTPQPNTDTETDESPPTTIRKGQNKNLLTENKAQKYGHRKQLSLYSWLSNTPGTSSNTAKPVTDGAKPTKLSIQSPLVSPNKSDHSKTFFTEMVSVPTSGKKIQDEKETFKILLQAISLKPKVAEEKDTAKTISLSISLKYLRVDLVHGEINNIAKHSKKPKAAKQLLKDDEPIFLAKDFNFRLLFSKSPLNTDALAGDMQSLSCSMVNRVKFNIYFGNITQKVNHPFVRLVVQLVDMLDVLAGLIKNKQQEMEVDRVDGQAPLFTNIFGHTKAQGVSPSSVKCWKTMYQVLDLYSSLPREPKTKPSFKNVGGTGAGRVESPIRIKEVKIDIEDGPTSSHPNDDQCPLIATYSIVGLVTLPRARLLASIGNLRLETEIKDVSLALTKTEEKDVNETDHHSGSVSAHIGNVNSVLLEKVKQTHGMVASVHLSRSHAVYSYKSHVNDDKNVALVTVGVIDVEIPQHPVALHTIVTRSSRTLSKHITDIQNQRAVIRSMGVADSPPPSYSKRLSGVPAEFVKHHLVGSPTGVKMFADSVDGGRSEIIPVKCDIVLKGLCLSASLLPSLRAGYKIGRIPATINTGKCSKFKAIMPAHSLMFSSKVQTFESNVPSSAMVDLPPVKISGEFLTKVTRSRSTHHRGQRGHLCVSAEIGSFQHCLTTDLLNHLVFVQKSFMKEVNDVVQRVSGESQPVALWRTVSSESVDSSRPKEAPFSYSFGLTLKGIQITATTPAATAVRLDTGVISLEVSNAVPSPEEPGKLKRSGSFVKLFGKAQVDVNLSLGQFIKSRMIDNVLDYVQMAYFKTTIGVRNSFQDVSSTHGTEDKETFLITLTQPKVYAQQMAFDKAVLVYLNYKNAYDHWNQQKMALHAEVHTATQALLEKLPARTHAAQLSGSLFLQLTVDRLGICVPLLSTNQPVVPGINSKQTDVDQGSVLILSVDEMMLSCCSSASLVSRGKFNKFCLWFADKFDMEAAEWRPDLTSRLMNTCVVSEGTYELCSRTNRYPIVPEMVKTGKWVMSIRWQMCGVEVLTDTNIGKWLSLLGNTLTAFAGETDIANMDSVADVPEKETSREHAESIDEVDSKPTSRQKPKKRSVEREMWEQARKVNELRRRSDVSQSALEKETKTLQDLENTVFNEFRKGVKKKIRRHSRSRQTHPYHLNTQKSALPPRKATSERAKTTKTRSRIRKQIAEEFNDSDYDGSSVPSREKSRDNLNSSQIPVMAATSYADKQSTSTLTWSREDVMDEGEGTSRFCSTPDNKQSLNEPGHHKVTFSNSATDLNDQNSLGQKTTLLTQQNLDFELDVIVNIDSGKCVLHSPSEDGSEESSETRPSANRLFAVDPPRSKPFSPGYSAGARRYKANSQDANSQQDTVILLPGVDVRVNYSSSFEAESGISSTSSTQDGSSDTLLARSTDQSSLEVPPHGSSSNLKIFKKAGLYISLLFQSLPQEMVLKPSLIDFVERALEPIIVPNEEEGVDAGGSVSDNGSDPECEAGGSIVSSSMSESSSFPVDVVVVFRVQPSDIRLSCQPVSKVECMLRLPALDVVFSSKSSSNKTPVAFLQGEPSQYRQDSRPSQTFDSGGISFTICLSSFSFCIFHPYGKEHTVVNRASSAPDTREDTQPRFRFNPPQPISGKKDSLSLDVEFIKFNLSRRRVCDSQDCGLASSLGPTSSTVVKVSGIIDVGSAAFTYDMRRLNEILDFPKAWYKRRLVSRLFLGKEGSYAAKSAKVASDVPFQTPEVIATMEEKRRSSPVIPEMQTSRMQPGRPILSRSMSEDERHMKTTTLTPPKTPSRQKSVNKTAAGLFSFLPTSPSLFRSMTMTGSRYGLLSPTTPHKIKRRHSEYEDSKKEDKTHHEGVVHSASDTDTEVDGPRSLSSSSSSGSKSKWETVIVVAVNLSRLDVNTNMGSVMGQTLWSTSDLRAQGNLTLTSTGRRHLETKVKVRQAVFESRSGIVGGHGEINDFIAKANGTEERGGKPEHMVQIKLCHAETRIDYMGTCILMGNISALQADLKDQWILQSGDSPSTDTLYKIEKESPVQRETPQCKIYVKADMSWTDFKLMISRSTTPDLIKMMAKIQEFFTQQHRNSLRALSTLRNPTPLNAGTILSNLATPQSTTPRTKDKETENDGLKYQHWSKVLNAVSGLKLSMLTSPLSDRGVVLGGSLALQGKTISLACFHGVNFRAQSWVLFNLKQIDTKFVSRVRAEEKSCYVRRVRAVQTLLIKLGHGDDLEDVPGNLSPSLTHVAVVRKVSRGRRNPPSMGSTVQEWLTYVCATQSDDDIYPSEEPATKRSDSYNSTNKKASQSGNRARTNSYRYEHDSEPVFGLPKFELELETKHDMPMGYLASTWSRKRHSVGSRAMSTRPSPHVVQCSLTSSFEDSLCVTMDVGLLFFLHDVVKSYIKETETSSSGSLPRSAPSPARSADTPEKDDREVAPKVDQQKRIRQFRSEEWKLEPRVRFMSWAGKNIEPVNIDWVLQKLGFTHARLTIPKWAQRGAMDPMDVFISILIDKMMATMQEDPSTT